MISAYKYTWGVDGYGRQHITLHGSWIVLMCVAGGSVYDCMDLLDKNKD